MSWPLAAAIIAVAVCVTVLAVTAAVILDRAAQRRADRARWAAAVAKIPGPAGPPPVRRGRTLTWAA